MAEIKAMLNYIILRAVHIGCVVRGINFYLFNHKANYFKSKYIYIYIFILLCF